jgi:hypothetical protein
MLGFWQWRSMLDLRGLGMPVSLILTDVDASLEIEPWGEDWIAIHRRATREPSETILKCQLSY